MQAIVVSVLRQMISVFQARQGFEGQTGGTVSCSQILEEIDVRSSVEL